MEEKKREERREEQRREEKRKNRERRKEKGKAKQSKAWLIRNILLAFLLPCRLTCPEKIMIKSTNM